MARRRERKSVGKKIFKKTANRTNLVNIKTPVTRGGTRF